MTTDNDTTGAAGAAAGVTDAEMDNWEWSARQVIIEYPNDNHTVSDKILSLVADLRATRAEREAWRDTMLKTLSHLGGDDFSIGGLSAAGAWQEADSLIKYHINSEIKANAAGFEAGAEASLRRCVKDSCLQCAARIANIEIASLPGAPTATVTDPARVASEEATGGS